MNDNRFQEASQYRWLIQRIYFIYVLLDLLYRAYSNVLLHQLEAPVLFDPEYDLTYWGILLSNLPFLLTHSLWVSIIFDILLFAFAIGGLIYSSDNKFPVLFSIVYFIYLVSFNLFAGHHYHTIGILMMSICFIVKNNISFSYMFYGLRYYFMFEMCSAFFWKIFRGTAFNVDQFASILMAQRIENTIFYPHSFSSQVTSFLIKHMYVSHAVWIILLVLQASFIIGFFTRKYDHLHIIAYILFAIGSYFLMNMFTLVLETAIYLLTLVRWETVGQKRIFIKSNVYSN